MISSANALKYSMWLAANHPEAFSAIVARIVPARPQHDRRGLGLGAAPGRGRMHPSAVRGRFGGAPGMGSFGDDIPEVTVTPPEVDTPVLTPTVDPITDPTLQQINVDVPDASFDLGNAASMADTSGGFWSSLGSGLASIGGGLSSAVGAVAQAVTNPQTLAAAGNVAAQVIKTQGSAQSQAQQLAILQAQQQRTLTGAGAQPLRYATDPQGRTHALYYNATTGQYQSNAPGLLSNLSSGGLSQYLPYILIGGGILLTVALLRR